MQLILNIARISSSAAHWDSGFAGLLLLVAMAVVSFTPCPAMAQAEVFGQYPVGAEVDSIATGDLNGDGLPDIIVNKFLAAGQIRIFLSDGAGRMHSGIDRAAPAGTIAVASADFDGSDGGDIVAVGFDANFARVYFNGSEPPFSDQADVSLPSFSWRSVTVGDLDQDGDVDFVVANEATEELHFRLNNGDRTFSAPVAFPNGIAGVQAPYFVLARDLDDDQKLDLIVANKVNQGGSGRITVFWNDTTNGSLAFAPAALINTAGANPRSLAVGNFVGDALADIAAPSSSVDSIALIQNNGQRNLELLPAVPRGVTSDAYSVAIGDLDSDGLADLVTANHSNNFNSASILRNLGGGQFTLGAEVPAGRFPTVVAVDDMNADQRPDLVIGNATSLSISVVLNQASVPPCPGDLNGDGVISTADLVQFLGRFGQTCQ